MTNDPFALLGVDVTATAGDLARAFAEARARRVPAGEARQAFDSLRDPDSREAMAILAISLTPGYQSLMGCDDQDAAVEAADLVIGTVSAVLADLDESLSRDTVMPIERVTRDVRNFVPAPMEELEP